MSPRTPLTVEQVTKRLADTGRAGDTSAIRRTFAVEYDTALRIIAKAGEAAIELNHRPDIGIRRDRPSFQVTAHTAGNAVTELDFKPAERINKRKIALRHGTVPA